MGGLLKLTSFTAMAGALAGSYYVYFVRDNGYYYSKSALKRINDQVQDVVERRGNAESVFQERIAMLKDSSARDLSVRSQSEMFKDLWNQQIRNTVEWIYSWGR